MENKEEHQIRKQKNIFISTSQDNFGEVFNQIVTKYGKDICIASVTSPLKIKNYNGEKVLLLFDYKLNDYNYPPTIRILDKYPFVIDYNLEKFKYLKTETIIILSVQSIDEQFDMFMFEIPEEIDLQKNLFKRRFDLILKVEKMSEPEVTDT